MAETAETAETADAVVSATAEPTEQAAPTEADKPKYSREDQTLLLFAGLMEGGKEDDDTVRELDQLTKLLSDDVVAVERGEASICGLIDEDCADTLFGYLDMRQQDVVRGRATLATSAYLKAAGEDGAAKLSSFFYDRVKRGTYDDYIVAFCVAAAVFPMVPDLIAELFLSEGFLPSLGPLMRRKWKSRKVETACLDMLNVACMNAACREAVYKYCLDWLEEIVDQDPDDVVKDMFAANPDGSISEGSVSMRRHSRQVQNLAAVVLAKLKAILPVTDPAPGESGRVVGSATTGIDDLGKMFAKLIVDNPEQESNSSVVEGLAYASLQPKVKEDLAANGPFLQNLIKTLRAAPSRSSTTYGALGILANLTRYTPVQSDEQKRLGQLRAYANAAGRTAQQPSALEDDKHVAARCAKVFAAGVTPVLVAHSKNVSPAATSLIVGIVHAMATTPKLRGKLAQQGAVPMLLDVHRATAVLPDASKALSTDRPQSTELVQRTAAQALARILISTDPSLVFGGNQSTPMAAAIRPLALLLKRYEDGESAPGGGGSSGYDLLPTFEGLMALTNLASVDDDMRQQILRAARPDIEEWLLSANVRVRRAAVELVCNLVQCAEGVALYANAGAGAGGDPAARNRLNILMALADAEDEGTRNAAGGAIATMLVYETVVAGVLDRPGGVQILLDLALDLNSEGLRHRGAAAILSIVSASSALGVRARAVVRAADGVAVLSECARTSREPAVVEIALKALEKLLKEPAEPAA